ncbi:hypothetical protein CDV31_016632 [Fusarium ambrosium]|uniref:Uncharacterized protein n=1 Tax=Fusarium ambrosium TaxID=131363 RepID=A0A428S5A8_9HYPO|nr:hypothetical protein CDV31_016632 [Fusarium ambrosium]
MALSFLPHEGNLVGIFLVLVLFFLAPASPAAVEPRLKVISIEEPESPTGDSPSFSWFSPRHSERDGSCPVSGQTWCGNELPGDFCCPSDSSCKVLAANTTILCCPEGSECNIIKAITCEIASQDPSKYPGAPIKTLAQDQKLKRCGSKSCCPFGYSCDEELRCVRDKDQEESYAFLIPEPSSTEGPTSTAEPSSTSPPEYLPVETSEAPEVIPGTPPRASASATSTSTESSTPDEEEEQSRSGVEPTGVVTAGTVAGVCCLAGIGIFVWMKWFRRKTPKGTPILHDTRESWGYFSSTGSTPMMTKYLRITRGPNEKFVVTPTTPAFSPLRPPSQRRSESPVELPATPVSLCMWSNLENAAVEEPKLAYVVRAKPQQ